MRTLGKLKLIAVSAALVLGMSSCLKNDKKFAIYASPAYILQEGNRYQLQIQVQGNEQIKSASASLNGKNYSFSAVEGSQNFLMQINAYSAPTLDTIKEQATTITDNLNSYDWVGTEGTVLRYLRRVKTTQQADGNLDIESECMKALVYPAESGDGVYEEYFYWGEKLFFAYIWYDETSEYYYYDDGELIRWIDSNGKCQHRNQIVECHMPVSL